jgi:uncharacterized protein (TIGR01777 family)
MPAFSARSPLPHAAADVFAWHARPGAFERLSPPWERVRVAARSGGIENGARLTLELSLGPFRRRWVAVHEGCDPPRQFRDRQAEGPFASWVHTHRFTPDDAGSILEDEVLYDVPGGALGAAAGGGFVRRKLERLFRFRHRRTAHDLERHARFAERPRLSVLVGGASGLVGSALVPFLTTGGHDVRRLVRGTPGPGEFAYDPLAGRIDAAAFDGIDAVVHLAGANVAAGRWSAARRREIRESRVASTALVARAIAASPRPPKVLVCASATGAYGDRGDTAVDEDSETGSGFLAEVCRAWEAATRPAEEAGVRVVHLRIGVVLAAAGGALRRLLVPFRAGLGGPVGGGRQFMSWIALDDVVGALHHALFDETLAGPVNATAPEPLRNADVARGLGRVLGRPALLPLPGPAVRALFGEMGVALLLGGARVLPSRLQSAGFRHLHPTLDGALRAELGR